jgi:hypothetical protein
VLSNYICVVGFILQVNPALYISKTSYESHIFFPIVKQDADIFIPSFDFGYGIKFNK